MVLGTILMSAALLKAHQSLTDPTIVGGSLERRLFAFGSVEVELALGWLLVTGYFPRAAWWLAVCCFTALAGVSLSEAAAGEASCGCFGVVPVSPWATFALDATAVAALLRWRPGDAAATPRRGGLRSTAAFAGWLIFSVAAGAVLLRPTYVRLDERAAGDGAAVLVEPARWVGKIFPLGSEIEINADFATGRWLVLFHRHSCPVCERALDRMLANPRGRAENESQATRMAVVGVPSPQSSRNLPLGAVAVQGRLKAGREWLLETPTLAVLENGVVTSATSGADVLEALALRPNELADGGVKE